MMDDGKEENSGLFCSMMKKEMEKAITKRAKMMKKRENVLRISKNMRT